MAATRLKFLLIIALLLASAGVLPCLGQTRPAVEVAFSTGSVIKADPYERQWLLHTPVKMAHVALRWRTTPHEGDDFARDYGYPEWSLGLMYGDYSDVLMHKSPSTAWGMAEEVDYTSDMGRVYTLFAGFSRPLHRSYRLSAGYALDAGLAYGTKPYNKHDNVDNELTGSRPLIYFGASLYASYRLTPRLSLRADLAFRHVSNGALDRPNKGANSISPSIAVQYDLDAVPPERYAPKPPRTPFADKRLYLSAAVGVGGKALLEEWLLTQFRTAPTEASYRTGHFRIYTAYSMQFDLMYRHSRRWASGIGADLFYGTYSDRVKEIDAGSGSLRRHYSPFSAGIALKHEAFYHNWSMFVSLGVYAYRHMGAAARTEETPYYERVGIRYHLPRLHNLHIGAAVKAHKTKADLTEVIIGMNF